MIWRINSLHRALLLKGQALTGKQRPLCSFSTWKVPDGVPPFSESSAYLGRDRTSTVDASLLKPIYIPSYYDSDRFRLIRLLSFMSSICGMLIYIAWFREPNEADELWNYDMRLVRLAAKRKLLKDQIADTKKLGRDTSALEADLAYIEVKEADIQMDIAKKREVEERRKRRAAERAQQKKEAAAS